MDAIEAIYRRDFHRFLRVAEAICGDAESARDAVQEGFAGALRGVRRFRGESSVETWIWSAVVNAARTSRRRGRLLPLLDEDLRQVEAPEPSGLPAVVAELPERQRLVLFLRHYADLDYASIAAVLAITPGTVGATLNHAHATLRQRLQEVTR